MKVHAFIICYNEAAMMPFTIRHYREFCDQITLIDNQSTDNTVAIAKKLFPALSVAEFDTKKTVDDLAYLRIKNDYDKVFWKKSKADFVIVCDTDEFLYHPDMKGMLAELKEKEISLPRVDGYNMVADSMPKDHSRQLYEHVTKGNRAYNFDKQIIFNPNIVEDINYSVGCHTCSPIIIKGMTEEQMAWREKLRFKMLHFKYMGKKYVLKKHNEYASRLSDFNKENKLGGEYLKGKEHIEECFKILGRHIEQVVDC